MGTANGVLETSSTIPLSGVPQNDGASHWYAVHVRDGSEDAMAGKCRQLLGSDVLEDCFVPKHELFTKRRGIWTLSAKPLFREYFFASTSNARALSHALGRLTFPVELVGKAGRHYVPLSREVQAWLEDALDDDGVLRASTGRIENGVLKVDRGPLKGCEASIRKVNRPKRMAYVGLEEGGSGFELKAALSIPVKV